MVGVTDVDQTLKELQLCLKPGGLLVLVEGDMILWDRWYERVKPARVEGDRPFEGQFEESWLQRLFLGNDPARSRPKRWLALTSLQKSAKQRPKRARSTTVPSNPWT